MNIHKRLYIDEKGNINITSKNIDNRMKNQTPEKATYP